MQMLWSNTAWSRRHFLTQQHHINTFWLVYLVQPTWKLPYKNSFSLLTPVERHGALTATDFSRSPANSIFSCVFTASCKNYSVNLMDVSHAKTRASNLCHANPIRLRINPLVQLWIYTTQVLTHFFFSSSLECSIVPALTLPLELVCLDCIPAR